MAQTKSTGPVPSGYGTVTPFIVSNDSARVIAFMAAAFNAKEKEGSRMFNLDGSISHVEVEVGESVVMLFDAGPLTGTTHASIGQEANAVAVAEHLRNSDHVFSNHRCHGHFLAEQR